MTAFFYKASEETTERTAFALWAVMVTLFLFFIDEGYYSFEWMLSLGNWFAFVVYASAIFGGQWLLARLVFPKHYGSVKTALCLIPGSVLGFMFVALVLFAR